MFRFIICRWETGSSLNDKLEEGKKEADEGAGGKPVVKSVESCTKRETLEMERFGGCFPVRPIHLGA